MRPEHALKQDPWHAVCQREDLIPDSGICALVSDQQIAIFYVPDAEPQVYALSNWDPSGEANVISRGIIGSIDGQLVVASPLYKQHFSLATGTCLEVPGQRLHSYGIRLEGDTLLVCV